MKAFFIMIVRQTVATKGLPVKVFLTKNARTDMNWEDGRCVSRPGNKGRERFATHKPEIKSAFVVKRYGIRLLLVLFEHLKLMPFQAAAQMEIALLSAGLAKFLLQALGCCWIVSGNLLIH
jgi:hypothetical protein